VPAHDFFLKISSGFADIDSWGEDLPASTGKELVDGTHWPEPLSSACMANQNSLLRLQSEKQLNAFEKNLIYRSEYSAGYDNEKRPVTIFRFL
jgi:hypothetical protein